MASSFWKGNASEKHRKYALLPYILLMTYTTRKYYGDTVRQLKQSSQEGLWCVLGDFNCIRHPSERIGKCERLYGDNSIQEFNEWIDDLEVLEAPSLGRHFTWFRPNGESRSRLDRFLISHEWRDRWPGSVQFTLPRNFSDHCPILLRT